MALPFPSSAGQLSKTAPHPTIRDGQKKMNLDWEAPAYPPPADRGTPTPLKVEVRLGDLRPRTPAPAK